jgi:hypothetical protein
MKPIGEFQRLRARSLARLKCAVSSGMTPFDPIPTNFVWMRITPTAV